MGGNVIPSKSDQIKLLVTATRMIQDSYICPKAPRNFAHWIKIVRFAHPRGYLYIGTEGGELDLVAIGYKVSELPETDKEVLPDVESGNILYVPILVSKSRDRWKVLKLLKYYLQQHPEVDSLAYHYRGTDKIKHFKMKEKSHVVI